MQIGIGPKPSPCSLGLFATETNTRIPKLATDGPTDWAGGSAPTGSGSEQDPYERRHRLYSDGHRGSECSVDHVRVLPLPSRLAHDKHMTFEATSEAGLARLADFVPRAGRAYAAERNTDRGPGDRSSVSTLSALGAPPPRHRARGGRGRAAGTLSRGREQVCAGGVLAHLLEGLARASAERVGAVDGGRRARARRAHHGAACDLRRGRHRHHRHRGLRRLGARAGRHRLPAQPRANVVCEHLDLHA